jgi:hypothetical protein
VYFVLLATVVFILERILTNLLALIIVAVKFGIIMVRLSVQVLDGVVVMIKPPATVVAIVMRQMVVCQIITNAEINAKGMSGIIMEPVVIAIVVILKLPVIPLVVVMLPAMLRMVVV